MPMKHAGIKRIVLPTGGIVRGKFPSRKNARMVQHRGLLELDAIYLFEASPLIERFREAPESLKYPDGPRLRTHTPAFQLSLRNGQEVLVDVVHARCLEESPQRRQRLEQLHAHLQRCDTAFSILTAQVVRQEPRLSSLRWIYRQASRLLPSHDACAVATASIAASLPNRLDTLGPLLAPTGIDACSLLLGGFLTCPLDSPVSHSTTIHLSGEAGHDWFRVSQELGF